MDAFGLARTPVPPPHDVTAVLTPMGAALLAIVGCGVIVALAVAVVVIATPDRQRADGDGDDQGGSGRGGGGRRRPLTERS
jgi:hypothetical protein